jgi:uncharacterized protein
VLLKPSWNVKDVTHLPLETLKSQGIKGFLFDLDDTLMAHKTGTVPPVIEQWLHHIKQQGWHSAVVSNNWRQPYLKQAASVLNLPVFGPAKKPRQAMFKQALQTLGLKPSQVVVVGDRPLTDILGGKLLGASTALVESMSKEKHNGFIRFVLWLERRFIRY